MARCAGMLGLAWLATGCLDSPGPASKTIDAARIEADAGDPAGSTEWQIPLGVSLPLVAIADDRVVVTAGFVGEVPLDPPITASSPLSDVLIAGFAADGEQSFAVAYGGDAGEYPGALAVSPTNGTIAVTGVYSGGEGDLGGAPMPAPAEGVAMFAAGYDELGTHVWSNHAVSTRAVNGSSGLSMNDAGGVAVTGDYVADLTVGTASVPFIGPDPDVYVARVARNGDVMPIAAYGSSGVQSGEAALYDGLGSLYLLGTFGSEFVIDEEQASNDGDSEIAMFVCRLDDDLDVAHWMIDTAGGSISRVRGAVTSDGSLLLTGSFRGSFLMNAEGAFALTSRGGSDVFIALISPDGMVVWLEQLGGAGDDEPRGIAVGPDGQFALTGMFRGEVFLLEGGPLLTSNGNGDIFVLAFDRDRSLRWARSFGDGDSDTGLSVALDSSGSVVVGAIYRGLVDFGGPEPLDAGDGEAGVLLRFR